MASFFLLNNLHFFSEIIGALVFGIVAWLAFDAFLIRRDFLTASRGIGFLYLGAWQVMHALNLPSDFTGYIAYVLYLIGLGFVLWNSVLEAPDGRPAFRAIVILPALSTFSRSLSFVATAGLAAIAWQAYRQYKNESKKSLSPFIIAFGMLAAGSFLSIFYNPESPGFWWIAGHLLELTGFFFLVWWVWNYLQLRIREEMLLIFVSFALFMAVIVSMTFSTILSTRVENEAKSNLITNTRVLDFAVTRLKEEALAKARFLAGDGDLGQALAGNKFAALQSTSEKFIQKEKLGFLTLLDKNGGVILRANALASKDENLSREEAVSSALSGRAKVSIESSPVEKFSIRAASPVGGKGRITGVVVAGFQLDNALVDRIKDITGLEMSIFDGNTRVASTAFNSDGRTRSTGVKEIDPTVTEKVLKKGEAVTLNTTFLSRPYLASFVPLRSADGRIVGMTSAAKPQREILDAAGATSRLTLAIVMAIMLILIAPIYLVTKKFARELTSPIDRG